MNYENFITLRYLTARKGGFLAFLNIVSVAGIAIGVMALIVVTGIMTGFGNNLRDKIIGTTAHLVIEKETGLKDYAKLQSQLMAINGVKATSPYVKGNVFLESANQAVGMFIRGIDPVTEINVTKIDQFLIEGSIDQLTAGGVAIGKEMSRFFGYKIGDELTLIAPGSGISGKGWRYTLPVVAIFNTGMVDYDSNLVVTSLKSAQDVFGFDENRVSGLGVKVVDPYKARDIKKLIYDEIGYSFLVRSWIDINRNLFEALFLEKWGLFLILTLMVLVAAFNVISTLIVTVMSKIHDIGVLQSFGVPQSSIRHIFTKQGMLIGIKGIAWGFGLGLGICYVLSHYVKVPEQIYSIEKVPVDLQPADLLIILGAGILISFLATIYPATRAANLQPVEALRYE